MSHLGKATRWLSAPPWNFSGNTPTRLLICPRAPELLMLATVCDYHQSGKLKIPSEPLIFSIDWSRLGTVPHFKRVALLRVPKLS